MKSIIIILSLLLFSSSFFRVYSQVDTSDTGKIAIERFDANAATREYIAMLSPEQKARSDAGSGALPPGQKRLTSAILFILGCICS